MKRLIINFGFAVSLVLLINCGQDDSGGGDLIYWTTYFVFDDNGEDLFLANDSYDVTKLEVSSPSWGGTDFSLNELSSGRYRFWQLVSLDPTYIDYGNGDIDTLTHVIKEHSHRSNYPSDIWYYLNDAEVAHFELTSEMILELGERNDPHDSRWTNDPILIVLPKKPEL
jgi:hypothetical protein